MGLNRRAAKRDGNEPSIYGRWAARLAYVQPVSGKGQPDTVVWFGGRGMRVETKRGKARLTPAQMEEFTDAYLLGVNTWIVRTEVDADALLDGTLEPWKPGDGTTAKHRGFRPGRDRARSVAELCVANHCGISHAPGMRLCFKHLEAIGLPSADTTPRPKGAKRPR